MERQDKHVEEVPFLCVQSTSASSHSEGQTYCTAKPEAPNKPPSHSQSLHLESTDCTPAQRGSDLVLVSPLLLPVTSTSAMIDKVAKSGELIRNRKSQLGILNLTTDPSYGNVNYLICGLSKSQNFKHRLCICISKAFM